MTRIDLDASHPVHLRPAAHVMGTHRSSFHAEGFFSNKEVTLVSLVAITTAVALANAGVETAGFVLWLGTGIALTICLLLDGPVASAVVVLGLSPLLNFLRQSLFYSSVVALLALAVLLLVFGRPRLIRRTLRRYRFVVPFGVLSGVYWVWSCANTHRYIVNFRVFELLGSCFLVLVVGQRPGRLKAALEGLTLSSVAYGLGLLLWLGPENMDRLGMVMVGDERVGNPITLGAPLALAFIALIVDEGRWLGFRAWRLWRVVLVACVVFLVALSTSRASWSVVLATAALSLLLARRRFKQLFGVLLMACAVWLVAASPFYGSFEAALDRTIHSDVSKASSGRSDQWRVARWALGSSLKHLFLGFGPGTGPEVYAVYSREGSTSVKGFGHKMEWHSLLLHTSIELGILLGIGILLLWLTVAWKLWHFFRMTGILFPLVCFVGYCLIVMTVIGFDISSGFFLGGALLPITYKTSSTGRAGVKESWLRIGKND